MNKASQALLCAAAVPIVSACASRATTEPLRGVFLQVASATTTATEVQQLRVRATITNDESQRLVVGNCLEPSAVIDSATATGWVELPSNQAISLAQCVAPLAIEARTSQTFDLVFSRANAAARFPRNVPLRLRIMLPDGVAGPVAPLQLP
ncbi:MAG TPA: hypothetical protein VE861_02250 [Gemmatimonadaceae bacterium]|nr:hypothetical protein [Gemmatimonadaceae bacterium]